MKQKLVKLLDNTFECIAYLLPRRICYWVIIRCWAYATTRAYPRNTPSEVTWDMVLKLEKEF